MSREGKYLDSGNIIKKVFENTNDSLRVDIVGGTITAPAGAATEAKQDVGNASLASIDSKLTAPIQVDVTNSAPTTVVINATDDSIAIGDRTTGDLMSVNPDGSINVDSTTLAKDSTLQDILSELQNDVNFAESVWYDKLNPTQFYIRTATVNQATGVKTISFQNIDGTSASPIIANLTQAAAAIDLEVVDFRYKAIVARTEYSVNDIITEIKVINPNTNAILSTVWLNRTTNTVFVNTNPFSDLIIDNTNASLAEQQLQTSKLTSIDSKLNNLDKVSKLYYNEVTSVAANVITTILSKTILSLSQLKSIEAAGENIAMYEVLINGQVVDKKYTSFGTQLNCTFSYNTGINLLSGDVLSIRVVHSRPTSSNFNAKFLIEE